MKKVLKSRIFIVIITLVIGVSGTLYATTKYKASEILYNETTVEKALNELYDKCGDSNIPEPVSFAEDSWETIVANVKLGNTSAYRIGETKEIELTGFTNGETNSNGLYTVRIANTSTPEECSNDGFSQTACGFVIEFVDIITINSMNSSATGVGGWKNSKMRTYVNDTIYNALPGQLRKNIIDTYVVSGHVFTEKENFTTIDKIYLLSTKEIGESASYDTATSETRELDYYVNLGVSPEGNSSVAIKNYNGATKYWWLRSVNTNISEDFVVVLDNGKLSINTATVNYGVAPAFRIG